MNLPRSVRLHASSASSSLISVLTHFAGGSASGVAANSGEKIHLQGGYVFSAITGGTGTALVVLRRARESTSSQLR